MYLCEVAKVERSSFYYWKKHKLDKEIRDQSSLNLVKAIYESSQGKAGIRQTKMKIQRKYKVNINLKKIARLKRDYNLVTMIRRKRKNYFNSLKNQEHRTKNNILNRDFKVEKADSVYSTDITEMRFGNYQKVYLSAVKDLCTKEIVAYTTALHPGLGLSLDVANKSLEQLSTRQRKKLIVHSDQGLHYTSHAYQKILRKFKVTQSMSRRGNCLDNAPIESFFGHMKDELDLSECEDYLSVKSKVKKYIFYYNNKRPQWDLNAKTPVEYRGFVEGSSFI